MKLKENLQRGRIISIDAFRGITIFVMIFVNELAGKLDIPQWLNHMPADADAMTFVDVVFPAFLFIVGMSIPFSFNARIRKGDSIISIWTHTLKRAAALIIMGLFMVNAEYGYNKTMMLISPALWGFFAYTLPVPVWNRYGKNFPGYLKKILQYGGMIGFIVLYFLYIREDGSTGMTPKWWGILGLIGWAYLLSVIVYWISNGRLYLLIAFFFMCVAANSISNMDGLAIKEMRWFGFLAGHMVHATLVVAGIIVSLLFFELKPKGAINWPVVAAIAVFFILGYFLRPYFEVSKIRGTPSWTLYSAGFCTLLYYLLNFIMEQRGIKRWSDFIMPSAENPLLIYILPGILIYLVMSIGVAYVPEFFRSGFPAIIWSMAFAVLMLYAVRILNRLGVRLHL